VEIVVSVSIILVNLIGKEIYVLTELPEYSDIGLFLPFAYWNKGHHWSCSGCSPHSLIYLLTGGCW